VQKTVGYFRCGDEVKITTEVTGSKSVVKVSLVNGAPAVDVEIKVKQNLASIEGEFDIYREENLKTINERSEKEIKSFCEKALHRTQMNGQRISSVLARPYTGSIPSCGRKSKTTGTANL
jgi:hypothetical protein